MTETRTPDTVALEELRQLLGESGRDAIDLTRALARLREQCTGDAATRWEIDRQELAFLLRQGQRPGLPAGFAARVEEARLAEVGVEARVASARPDNDAAAVFELANLRALFSVAGRGPDAEALGRELQRRLPLVEIDAAAVEEARERFAVMATEEEDLSLAEKAALLRETAGVYEALAARTGSGPLRRMARRMRRMAGDRILAQRLERLLTPRGAAWLEITSLVLLLAVFALLLLESMFDWSQPALDVFLLVDGSICLFFIAEFVLKVALAPDRLSWFLRNVLTDLLPAIPAAMVFAPTVDVPTGGDDVVFIRALRLLRITYFARYIRALRPTLRLLRLLLFLVKGMDGLVRRFSPLLNRNFVFFERPVLDWQRREAPTRRETLFRALRREHVLLAEAPVREAGPVLLQRAEQLLPRLEATTARAERRLQAKSDGRDIAVEQAIRALHELRADEMTQVLSLSDIQAIDRVVRVINAPIVRSLPLVRAFTVRGRPLPVDPVGRVLALARQVALYLERWRSRLLFWADLHGVVTGPQLLDRVATAMVKASQRPAVRLLLFGGLFFLVRLLVGAESGPGLFLKRFVAAPLIILGSVCAVFLTLGWWLKKLAGEASEAFKLTSEANFIVLLELVKTRREADDARFLAHRVFRWELDAKMVAKALRGELCNIRADCREDTAPAAVPDLLQQEVRLVSLLYLHFLDGSPLHPSDIKTTEQLLANSSLENVRTSYLRYDRKDRKRLKKLSLTDGSLFSGPYMWFSFITESIAVETAKRITDYNRHCLTLEQQRVATADELEAFAIWRSKRAGDASGRTIERMEPPGGGDAYVTTEFCALDFLSTSAERDEHIARTFGAEILDLVRSDRRRMIREIFGMRPMHRLPRHQRSFNAYAFYRSRLSHGRMLLLPVYLLVALGRLLRSIAYHTATVVREILDPARAARHRDRGETVFAVALRKIHRMKAPGLLEAMRLRAAFDPAYCGAPPTWSDGFGFEERSELERDMDFLRMKDHHREELRATMAAGRRRIAELHRLGPELAGFTGASSDLHRRLCERAVSIAWLTDRDCARSLMRVPLWLDERLPLFEAKATRVRASRLGAIWRWLRRRGGPHPVDAVIADHWANRRISRRGRRNLRAAWQLGDPEVRAVFTAMAALDPGADPTQRALASLRDAYRRENVVNRDLAVVRAVQSLTVLDVRNYRELVFELGGYAADGEDPQLARALP